VRRQGLLVGIELVEDKKNKQPADASTMGAVLSTCEGKGLIVGQNGNTTPGFNNVLTLCPPLNITDDDLEFIAATIKEVIRQV
jgi:taurine-pyruvate aminotransferase